MAYLEYVIAEKPYDAELKADENTLGRAPECTLQLLHDPELSRVHCTVRRHDDGSFVLLDHGSTNGTYVNEHRVGSEEAPLHDGDRIRIGITVLVFRQAPIGRTTVLFSDVEKQLQHGDGFHTIMDRILHRRKKP
jgi:pSer/pThr/pTyr-binding forkhead associated (FHA) protein